MKLTDVKIDGNAEYYCSYTYRPCVIIASHVDDGACLIASHADECTPMVWLTESCYLELETGK